MEFKRPITINELTEVVIGLCIKYILKSVWVAMKGFMKKFYTMN